MRGRTSRIVRAIPPDQLEWTYRPGKFTLGDIVRHLAALERHMFARTPAGSRANILGTAKSLPQAMSRCSPTSTAMHQETVDILRSLPDARLEETCETPGGARLRVWKWLRAMIEHEVHHRGQIYLYLGMLDIDTPPLYGLTSEQVLDRSGKT